MSEEIHDAITGHAGKGGVGRDYGEYEVATMYRAILNLPPAAL